ncbi:TPA: hypothetical protein KDZ08_004966 [Vibrio parahaemolyticus]|uniref:hypothetical protein n=1 Tax=Vibrio TaxID=662 RepID=UPI001B841A0C|nr:MULTISPECIES: hypothetical protein [Vibrio]BDP38570.1 hypothetical protein VA208B3_49410 [Vibrio alginolyticus]MCR9817910.1 hypothetical protein [Vibrio parahaemolyticus]BDP33541.1 hypothetical protein VV208B2_46210 [Vibrio vulnificus]HBC3540096.1 hypothetical protein [Vibrio parahaemolyticus]HBC3593056.1 hypothetical protein [Vibrio parahaemolyticus]
MTAIIEIHQQDNPQDIDLSEGKQVTKEQETANLITGLMGNTSTDVVRVHLSDIEKGLLDTSPMPRGNWRSSWVMYLSKQPCSCRLPRGFGKFNV